MLAWIARAALFAACLFVAATSHALRAPNAPALATHAERPPSAVTARLRF